LTTLIQKGKFELEIANPISQCLGRAKTVELTPLLKTQFTVAFSPPLFHLITPFISCY